ncbi:MAG: N-acetylmuramoyl-L-alanine amidase [Roseburia sp.]|nr:N-acetylmuramoyl-L-alanine amidase [Roseburia sp.]
MKDGKIKNGREYNDIMDMMKAGIALTQEEKALILSLKRDRFHAQARAAAVVLCALSVLLMVGFKLNESFLDANSRFSLLMESVNRVEENLSYPKINVRAEFSDVPGAQLVLLPDAPIPAEHVSVREEFTGNKLVVTLSGASEAVQDGVRLIMDSGIMDAVGVYRQNQDVVVEIFCNDTYNWELHTQENGIAVSFEALRETADKIVVVYMPYEDRNRLAIPEWQQSLSKFAADNGVRLFLSYNMQESYTGQEIVAFANAVRADMLLGIEVKASAQGTKTDVVTVCNPAYFIPDFNSAQLAILLEEAFADVTGAEPAGFRECGAEDVLVSEAVIPAALIELSVPQSELERVELLYKLNESILAALKRTITDAVGMYPAEDSGGMNG